MTEDNGLFWLVWVPAGFVLVLMTSLAFVALVPLAIPYYIIRQTQGKEVANRWAMYGFSAIVVITAAAYVISWVNDPASFFLTPRTP